MASQQMLRDNEARETFASKNLLCINCNTAFLFSSSEQIFFNRRGLNNEPKRCANCRVLRRMKKEEHSMALACRVHCARCSQITIIPFEPANGKSIYCFACLPKNIPQYKIQNKTEEVENA